MQHENNARHIKILVDPGESVSDVLVKSYEPHFTMYLDDRKKFIRLIIYLIPKFGLEKRFIDTSNKFLPSWLYQPSKNYSNLENKLPADLADMGINKGNFVLFAHASKKYYEARFSLKIMSEIQYRFLDLSTYDLALNKIIENNLKIIRIGIETDELPEVLQTLPIIDYNSEIRTEQGEMWLYENCKFLLSVSNGAFWFARRFDQPTLLTNNYLMVVGYQPMLFTPMLIRNYKRDHIHSFSEMFELRTTTNFPSKQFMKDHHLEFLPNSPLTISNAVAEMLDLVTDNNICKPEDLELMNRYSSILASFNIPVVEKMTLPTLSFLREYSHLL